MVLHFREQDDIVGANEFSAPRLRDQIDALGRAAGKHDLLCIGGPEIIRDPLPRSFVGFGRARAQLVQAAMHIGVGVLVILPQNFEHRARLLRRRGVVEINQGPAMDALAQDGEILTQRFPINRRACGSVHGLICFHLARRATRFRERTTALCRKRYFQR